MILWYLLIAAGGQPQVFPSEQQACQVVSTTPGARIYLVSGHRDNPTIADGECTPVETFVQHK